MVITVAPSCIGTAPQSITLHTPLERQDLPGSGTRPIMAATGWPGGGEA
jgi:hypothetical protein